MNLSLAMIVQRDHEVKNFIRKKYFTCDLKCGDFRLFSARIDDKSIADSFVSACNGNSVTVPSVKKEIKTVNPLKLYDLTTLRREVNKAYGYTAQQTLDCVQSLYEGTCYISPNGFSVSQ